MKVSIRNIEKSFGATAILRGISCDIEPGEFVTLLGPSGCGKTTLLRILAGLDSPDRGAVHFDGFDGAQWTIQERQVGFVFQHYALFPHLNAFDNIAFGLRMRSKKNRLGEHEIKRRVDELLNLVQLSDFARHFPQQLSGGQKQRVALARALAIEPRILLLDEPFGALDVHVRQELRTELRKLQKQLHITCLLVTHDQDEALEMSDRIILLNQGLIEQIGSPEQVYNHPRSAFAMNYLGSVNRLPAQLLPGQSSIRSEPIFVRAHEIELFPVVVGSLQAKVQATMPRGGFVQLDLEAASHEYRGPLKAEIPRERWENLGLERGHLVSWRIKAYKEFHGSELGL